jgi:hypothetical protein
VPALAGLEEQFTSSVSWYWQVAGSVAAVTAMVPPHVNVTFAVRGVEPHSAPLLKYCDRYRWPDGHVGSLPIIHELNVPMFVPPCKA